jgi:hypothetical protein
LFFLGKIGGNNLKFILQISVLCLLGLNTSHADTWISIGGGTYHTCNTCNYNGANPGLGIQHDLNDSVRFISGGYYNSFRKASFYGGAAWQPLQYGILRAGVVGGVVTNYDNLKIPLMALPMVSIEGSRVGVDILGFPAVGSKSGIVSANLKFKL